MQSFTSCKHCGHNIDLYKQMYADKFVKAQSGPPDFGRVIGVECDSCNQQHPAPGPKEEDWFE